MSEVKSSLKTVLKRLKLSGLLPGLTDRALYAQKTTLAPLGAPTSFVQTAQHERGGMLERIYRVNFSGRVLRVWTYEMPDGKIEQYQLSPAG